MDLNTYLEGLSNGVDFTEKVFDFSIDKLAFTGDFVYYKGKNPLQVLIDQDAFGKYKKTYSDLDRTEEELKTRQQKQKLENWYNVFADGTRGKIFDKVYFELLNPKAYVGAKEFRLVLNPNKLEPIEAEFVKEQLMPMLTRVSLTEIHLAFDTTIDLRKHLFLEKGNESRERWSKHDKKLNLETINLGSRSSDNFVTTYDKIKERKPYYDKYKKALKVYEKNREDALNKGKFFNLPEPKIEDFGLTEKEVEHLKTKQTWWRVEFKLRDEYARSFIEENKVFKSLRIVKPIYKDIPKKKDKMEVFYYYHHPEELGELDRKTKSKKLALLIEHSKYDLIDLLKLKYHQDLNKLEKDYQDYYDKSYVKFYDYVKLLTLEDIENGYSDDERKQDALYHLVEVKKLQMQDQFNEGDEIEKELESLVYDLAKKKRNEENGGTPRIERTY